MSIKKSNTLVTLSIAKSTEYGNQVYFAAELSFYPNAYIIEDEGKPNSYHRGEEAFKITYQTHTMGDYPRGNAHHLTRPLNNAAGPWYAEKVKIDCHEYVFAENAKLAQYVLTHTQKAITKYNLGAVATVAFTNQRGETRTEIDELTRRVLALSSANFRFARRGFYQGESSYRVYPCTMEQAVTQAQYELYRWTHRSNVPDVSEWFVENAMSYAAD